MKAFRWILMITLPSTVCDALARLTVPTSRPRPSSSFTPLVAVAFAAGASWTFASVASLVPIFPSFLECLELRQSLFDPAGLRFLDLDLVHVRVGRHPRIELEERFDERLLIDRGVRRTGRTAAESLDLRGHLADGALDAAHVRSRRTEPRELVEEGGNQFLGVEALHGAGLAAQLLLAFPQAGPQFFRLPQERGAGRLQLPDAVPLPAKALLGQGLEVAAGLLDDLLPLLLVDLLRPVGDHLVHRLGDELQDRRLVEDLDPLEALAGQLGDGDLRRAAGDDL